MKQNSRLIKNSERLTKLNDSIVLADDKTMMEIHQWVDILKNHFGFNDLVHMEINYILKCTWHKYKELFNQCFYESVAIACMVFAYERCFYDFNYDLHSFIEESFVPSFRNKIISQVNRAYFMLVNEFNNKNGMSDTRFDSINSIV